MRTNATIRRLIAEAERDRRCCHGETRADRRALRRRAVAGELKRVYCNTYMTTRRWNELTPPQRVLYTARSLGVRHRTWVFGGHVAVAAHGLEHPWNIHDGTIVIMVGSASGTCSSGRLRRVYAPNVAPCIRSGIRVTGVERTLIDCALTYPFAQTLPMFDSALRKGLTESRAILAACGVMTRDVGPVLSAVAHADARSENGGESECRGVMLEEGFAPPELQVAFDCEAGTRRVDYLWRCDGAVIALEFDGTRKYVDPAMTGGDAIRQVVADERAREDQLLRAGVTAIIRTDWDEVRARVPLVRKLLDAGVPRPGGLL